MATTCKKVEFKSGLRSLGTGRVETTARGSGACLRTLDILGSLLHFFSLPHKHTDNFIHFAMSDARFWSPTHTRM